MRLSLRCAAGAAVVALLQGSASALVVADYRDDFETDGTPAPGWSYQWNATGPINTPAGSLNTAALATLVGDSNFGGDYETVANEEIPDPAPGAFTIAANTFIHPGQGSAQAADGIERYTLASYTISAGDIAAAGGNQLSLDDYIFSLGASTDGVNAKVYKNDTLFIDRFLPPGIVFSSDLPDPNGGPIPLGAFDAGDTLRVAIGSNLTDNSDTLTLDYSIVLSVPEPSSLGAAAGAGLLVLGRRRRPA